MSTYNQRVMGWAHVIRRTTECAWSEALQRAWDMFYIHKWLCHDIVKFVYIKSDGSVRAARGTLHPELIPEEKRPKGIRQMQIAAGVRKPDYRTIAYFDLDKRDWRTFSPAYFIQECSVYLLSPATDNNEEEYEDWKQMDKT